MSVITFPTALYVTKFTWQQAPQNLTFRTPFGVQSVEISSPLWKVSLELDRVPQNQTGAYDAISVQLRGAANQLEIWKIDRPAPVGTMRGTMTLNGSHASGATTLSISAGVGQAATTLVAGDMLGVGSATTQQVVMVIAAATADGSGDISVSVQPPLRNAFTTGSAVTWDKPKALFRLISSSPFWTSQDTTSSGWAADLMEDVRP